MNSSLRKVRLGDLISPVRIRCGEVDSEVVGVDINHHFIPTRANLAGVDTSKYLVVPYGCFACNLMHIGRDERIPLAYNDMGKALCITPAYYVFRVKESMLGQVLPEFLYLYMCRQETDRYTWFCTDSSIRGNLPENRLLDIEIPVPDRETQRRLVDVWEGLDGMKRYHEAQAAPLMELCMSYLKKLSVQYAHEALGQYIEASDRRNTSNRLAVDSVKGISINKSFIDSKANMEGVALSNYKIVQPHEFAFVTVTSRNGEKISLALNASEYDCLVSATYEVFRIASDELLPEYLYLWFLRPEFDRYARFHSWGSARETFSMDEMKRVQIPIPPKPIQQAIVDIYACAKECKDIAEQAGQLRRIAAPALMQKAIHLSTLTNRS